jgi:hypothetical protein
MGWLFQRDPIDDPVGYLTDKFTYDGERHTLRVLAAAHLSNTVYMAVCSTEKQSGSSYVFAAVILISNTTKDGFGYKDMDESMGPCECACPQRIMRILTPIAELPNPGHAAAWRARVAAYHENRRRQRARRAALTEGTIVKLSQPARFPGGLALSEFRVAGFRGRTPIYESLDRLGFRCRLRAATIDAATIDAPSSVANSDAGD